MRKHFFYRILPSLIDARREEFAPSVVLFFYFFFITASTYIIKPVKISLFLEWLDIKILPLAYLLTAIFIGFFAALNAKFLNSLNRKFYISLNLIFYIATLLLFRWLFQFEWKWLSLVFWFWADIFTVTSVTQYWILVHDTYHPRQAKRLIGFLVSGGLLGGVTGSLLSSLLPKIMGTKNLLLICPLVLVLCLGLMELLRKLKIPKDGSEESKSDYPKKSKIDFLEGFHLVAQNRHLFFLSGIVASAIIVTTLVDFQFNSVIKEEFKVLDSRTAFLGSFFSLLLIFSTLFNMLVTTRILKTFGLRFSLLITPLSLLIGTITVFFVPSTAFIYWITPLKGVDKSLAHSLGQSVRELLYIPVSPEIKYKAKVFIDMFVSKLARAIGALFLFLALIVLKFNIRMISLIVLFVVLWWITLNWSITKEYIGIVKRNLQIKWQNADKFISEKIDVDMTKLVFDTLQSKDRSSILYAMNMFDLIKSNKLSPELKKILSSKTDQVRARSLDSLLDLEGEEFLPGFDDSLEAEDLNTQVKEIMSLDVYQELMGDQIAQIVLTKERGDEVSKMEAAKLLGMMTPTPQVIFLLGRLLREDWPEVARYALESAGELKKREFIPLIVSHLKEPANKEVASQILVDFGTKIVGTLKDYLSDGNENIKIRKAIPEILFRIGNQKAANLMIVELKKRDSNVGLELIESLFKLRTKNPNIQFRHQDVLPEILFLIRKGYQILLEIHSLISDEKKKYLVSDLDRNLARSLKEIFELLSLIYFPEDILRAYQNISSGKRKAADYSIELLDNILKREIKEYLFPLIENVPFNEKARRCRKMLKALERAETS